MGKVRFLGVGFGSEPKPFALLRRQRHAALRASACLVARAPSKLGRLRPDTRQANCAVGSALLGRDGASSYVALLYLPSRVLGFAWTNTEPTSVRRRQRHAALRAPVLLRAHLPRWKGFAQILGKRTVPWVPLSLTVLAQPHTWRCSCLPSRVLGFAWTNNESTSVHHRQRHVALRGSALR